MSKILPIIFAIIIFSLFFVSPHKITAQEDDTLPGPPDIEGWYCKGVGFGLPGTIWHQVPSGNPDVPPTQIEQEECGADEQCAGAAPPDDTYFGEVACLKTGITPIKGPGTIMYANPGHPGNITQGNQLQITISSNQMLGPKCDDQVDVSAIKGFGRIQDCHVTSDTQCGCNIKHIRTCSTSCNAQHQCTTTCVCTQTQVCGPADWRIGTKDCTGTEIGFNPYDDRQCTTTFTCTTNSLGDFDLPFRPANSACWNDATFSVVPPADTNPNPTADCQDSNGNIKALTPDNNVLADSLRDDLDNQEKMSILLPDSIDTQLDAACKVHNPDTGIERGFLTKFICDLANFPVVGGIIGIVVGTGNLCPKEVQFVNQDTNCLTVTSQAVENRTRPPELKAPPQRQACEISDILKGNASTVGNLDTSSISAQIGGPQGVYTEDTPEFPDIGIDIAQNLYTEGKVLDGDLRVPDVNSRCKIYSGANLYESISFCADPSLQKLSGTNDLNIGNGSTGGNQTDGGLATIKTSCPVPGGTISTHSYSASPTNGHCSPGYSLEGRCTVCKTGGIGVSRRANAIDVPTNGKSVVLPTVNGQDVTWKMIVSYGVAGIDGGGNGYTFETVVEGDTYTLDMLHLAGTSLRVGQSYPSGTAVAPSVIDHVHMTMGKDIVNNKNIGNPDTTDCDPGWLPSDFMCQ